MFVFDMFNTTYLPLLCLIAVLPDHGVAPARTDPHTGVSFVSEHQNRSEGSTALKTHCEKPIQEASETVSTKSTYRNRSL